MTTLYTPKTIKAFVDNAKETEFNVKDTIESLSVDHDEYRSLLENVFDLNVYQEERLEALGQRIRILQKIDKAIERIYDDEDI